MNQSRFILGFSIGVSAVYLELLRRSSSLQDSAALGLPNLWRNLWSGVRRCSFVPKTAASSQGVLHTIFYFLFLFHRPLFWTKLLSFLQVNKIFSELLFGSGFFIYKSICLCHWVVSVTPIFIVGEICWLCRTDSIKLGRSLIQIIMEWFPKTILYNVILLLDFSHTKNQSSHKVSIPY